MGSTTDECWLTLTDLLAELVKVSLLNEDVDTASGTVGVVSVGNDAKDEVCEPVVKGDGLDVG